MDTKYQIKQPDTSDIEIVNPDFKRDNITVWSFLETEDCQVIHIERKNIDAVCEALQKCKR